jgi:glycosyltransferase involved in cell wall biosynthesis
MAHLTERRRNSVVSQWDDAIEIIVISAGSTDNTQEVLTKYQHNVRARA